MKEVRIFIAKIFLPLGYGVYHRGELREVMEGHGVWGLIAKTRLEEFEK